MYQHMQTFSLVRNIIRYSLAWSPFSFTDPNFSAPLHNRTHQKGSLYLLPFLASYSLFNGLFLPQEQSSSHCTHGGPTTHSGQMLWPGPHLMLLDQELCLSWFSTLFNIHPSLHLTYVYALHNIYTATLLSFRKHSGLTLYLLLSLEMDCPSDDSLQQQILLCPCCSLDTGPFT